MYLANASIHATFFYRKLLLLFKTDRGGGGGSLQVVKQESVVFEQTSPLLVLKPVL